MAELLIFDPRIVHWFANGAETSRAHNDMMLKRTSFCLFLCVHAVPNRAALHEDDRVVTVLALHRR